MDKQRRAITWCIAAALFGLALWVRAWSANAFITWDEPAWTYRSARFLLALGDGRLRDTLQTGHPGVLTMWSGALGLLWHRLVTGNVSAEALSAVQALPELDIHDATTLRLLGGLLPYAKAGILPLYALLSAATFLLLDRLLPRGAAILASALLLLEPSHLALTRVLHIDGITAACMLLSTLAALVWARERRLGWLIVSGAALGVAVTTKSYAAMCAPVTGMIILLARVETGRPWRARVSAVFGWSVAALGAFVLLWPAMWVSPWRVVVTMFDLAFGYATSPGDATTAYYFGALREAIDWTFYPVVLYLRTTPTTLIGLALGMTALVGSVRRPREERDVRLPLAMLALAISYLMLVSLGAKKFDRYALPALLAVDVFAAWGYWAAWRWLANRWQGAGSPRFGAVALCVIAASCAVWLAPYAPHHYLAHYNALAGGPSGAAQVLPLGWGEGVDLAAEYLASQPDADDLHVASWAVAGLAPAFPGVVMTPENDHLPDADYVVFTIGDMQNEDELVHQFAENREPAFVGNIAGQPFVWVYALDDADQLSALLRARLSPGDLIIADLPSALERRHGDSLPLARIDPAPEEETARALRAAASARGLEPGSRIFRIRWIDDRRANPLEWQIEQNAVQLSSEPIPYGNLQVYRMVAGPNTFQPILVTPLKRAWPAADQIALTGVGLAHQEVVAGQRIGVALAWQTLASPSDDYQVFLHLVDATNHKWGQRDLALVNEKGDGTADWPANTRQITRATVPLTPGIVPGQYTLVAGLYRWQDGQALGAPVALGAVTVKASDEPATVDLEALGIDETKAIEMAPGIALLAQRLGTQAVGTGEAVDVWLTWRCAEKTEYDWRIEIALSDGDQVVTQTSWPAGEDYKTSQWRPGEALVHPVSLVIDRDLPSGRYVVTGKLIDASGVPSGVSVDLGTLAVQRIERHAIVPASATPLDIRFGDDIALVGFELAKSTNTSAKGQRQNAISVGLYWQALHPPDQDWTVFIHALDDHGLLQGQVDTQPSMGTRPTSGWLQDEIVWDSAHVRLHDTAQPGTYRLAIGLYDAATGQRAPAYGADRAPLPDDRLILPTTITVQ